MAVCGWVADFEECQAVRCLALMPSCLCTLSFWAEGCVTANFASLLKRHVLLSHGKDGFVL